MSPRGLGARQGRRGLASRVVVGVVGVGLALVGVWAARSLAQGPLVGAALWLAAAVVLHDGVLAPATSVLGRGLRRLVGPSAAAHRTAVSALVAAVVMTLVAVPGLAVRAAGPRNASVHPTDYAVVLAVVWAAAVLVVLGAAATGRVGRVSRRRGRGGRAGSSRASAPRSGRTPAAPGGAEGGAPGSGTS